MKKCIITISRTYGSGGKAIGKRVSELLGIPYCNRDMLQLEPEISGEVLSGASATNEDDRLFAYQSEKIKSIADAGSCVIIGRCADYLLDGRENLIKIYIYAPQRSCMRRIMNLYGFHPDEAKSVIAAANRERSTYYNKYTGLTWHDPHQYHLCIDSSVLGIEETARLICDYAKRSLESNQ